MNALARLSESDTETKSRLEDRIRKAIASGRKAHFEIGECLDLIIGMRLYRDSHSNFDDYCAAEWGFSGTVGRRAANAYQVAKTLELAEQKQPEVYWSVLTGLQPCHAEQLAALPEEVQPVAWADARADTMTPTVKALGEVVAKHKGRLKYVANMTADEELEFREQIERDTEKAYKSTKIKELAALSAKRVRSIKKGISDIVAEDFSEQIKALDVAEGLFLKLA